MCWQGASSTTTGRRQGSRAGLPKRGDSPDARRVLVPKAAKTRGRGARCALLPLFLLSLRGRALGESSAPHGSTSPGEKAFRRIRGISKNSPTAQAALWERPAPHEPRFPWREGVLLGSGGIEGSRVGACSGRSPRCMTLLNGSGRKLMAHA